MEPQPWKKGPWWQKDLEERERKRAQDWEREEEEGGQTEPALKGLEKERGTPPSAELPRP